MNNKNYMDAIGYVLTDFELKNSTLKLDALGILTELSKRFWKELTPKERQKLRKKKNQIDTRCETIAKRLKAELEDFGETLDIYEAIIKNIGRDV